MAKKGQQPKAETTEPVEPQEDPKQPEEQPQQDPETPAETPPAEDPEQPAEPEPGPLSKLQEAINGLLDYDQITEIRLALYSRETELEKHAKKGSDLGVREEDARRRLHVIRGDSLRFGLTRVFAEAQVTEQRDAFFDREKPNGRPDADETITFRTVDGRDITCHRDRLEADHLEDIRALYRAGKLTLSLENAAMDGDFMHLIEEDELETAGVAE